ncbi:hypothetical protein P691DRAFT_694680 [Macrolepiota fuliginosa MF-IS2]|uniref:Zn(2)-C6 fungal-type domain-containing protein n=1 Tax=Macrolepiota fuliginosa MF-IS2 TaxID=1400762 RepID=A0A9P5XL08_9AGAR|nr:hypothetical protein P691DRAFT_694680 [Macrolepiota fuliginosa MF-IS2]
MSGSYNMWQQNSGLYPQQADFAYPTNGRQQQQQAPQQSSTTFSSSFQLPQSSSSLQGAFGATGQHERGGSSNSAQSGAYLQGALSSNQPHAFPQDLSVNTSPYRTDSSSLQYNNNYVTASPGPIQEHYPQPTAPVLRQSQPNYYRNASIAPGGSAPQTKRQRGLDRNPEEDDGEPGLEKDGAKKHSGACARCKNLKVKCEFVTDPETCKRCLNGGHECVIPGRKKRRVPPKREHLINQIRLQAEQINNLIAQLEAVQRSQGDPPNLENSSAILQSPIVSPDGDSTDESGVAPSTIPVFTEGNRAIEDWLSQAKESFLQFGNSISKSYLSDEDSDSSGWEEDYDNVGQEDLEGYGDEEEKYDIAVEHAENGSVMGDLGGQRLKNQGSNSSLNTTATSVAGSTGQPRKKSSGDKSTNLPSEAAPWGLMGRLSIKNRATSMDPEDTGITSSEYFTNGSAEDEHAKNVQRVQPHILNRGVITTSDAEKLFAIYFEKMNDSSSLLDPMLYTPPLTAVRSTFLFTVMCAIASRFYDERPELYPQLMHYAQLAAGTALISGTKNVEMCAAYILLSLYPVPTRRMTEQRSWLYLGLAIRTATDLNLHIPIKEKPRNEWQAREILNRTRIWLNCYNLDRSTGSQYGKPPIISNTDYVANHSADWYQSSPYNLEHFDIHICAYNAELRVMAKFMAKIYNDPEQPTGLNKNVDFEAISTATDDELKALGDKWFSLLETTNMNVPQNRFRTGLLRLAYSYSRLIALSYGFQHAFGKNTTDENPFLIRCLDAARGIVHAVIYDICRPDQLFYVRHGPEAQSIFVTFASAFLIKLLQPRFASHMSPETRTEIKGLVQSVVELLSSKEVAIDERHGPGLYARFLRNLLQAPILRQDPLARRNRSIPKSAGATPELSDHASLAPISSHPSPARSGGSLSPPPSQEMTSFDMFAPVGIGATDPYFQGLDSTSTALGLTYMTDANSNSNSNTSAGTISDMFMPPLTGDNLIMQNMQVLSGGNPGSFDWQSNNGYAWYPQFQQNMGMNTLFDTGSYARNT